VIISLVVTMSREQPKRGKHEKSCDGAKKVIVAVKASKEIPKTALVWSLTHVVQPGDCITLLVVVPSQSSGYFSFASFSFVYFLLFFGLMFVDACPF
jgi:hypothetical protein